MRTSVVTSSALLAAVVLSLAGCAEKKPETRLTLSTGHTSRIVRDAEVITLPIYAQDAADFDPGGLTFRSVTVREPHTAAQPARWSITAAGAGARGPTIGLVVTLPTEATGPLVIEADLDYDDHPRKLVATLVRTSVGSRRVWLLKSGAVQSLDR